MLGSIGAVGAGAVGDDGENIVDKNECRAILSSFEAWTGATFCTACYHPEHVDKTGNGLDFTNDHGNGTKIKYFRHSKNYGWRTPYEGVNYNEGLNSKNTDDRASYVYGEKELWYVDQIESRTTIAIFHYDEREDACGALKGGGRDDNDKQLKLVKISILVWFNCQVAWLS